VALQAYLAISNMEQATGIPQTFPDWHNQEAGKKYDDLFGTFVPLARKHRYFSCFLFLNILGTLFRHGIFGTKNRYADTPIKTHMFVTFEFIQVFVESLFFSIFSNAYFISHVSKLRLYIFTCRNGEVSIRRPMTSMP